MKEEGGAMRPRGDPVQHIRKLKRKRRNKPIPGTRAAMPAHKYSQKKIEKKKNTGGVHLEMGKLGDAGSRREEGQGQKSENSRRDPQTTRRR